MLCPKCDSYTVTITTQGLGTITEEGMERTLEDGRGAVKCCVLKTGCALHSIIRCSYGKPHKTKLTGTVRTPTGSTNWSQWTWGGEGAQTT